MRSATRVCILAVLAIAVCVHAAPAAGGGAQKSQSPTKPAPTNNNNNKLAATKQAAGKPTTKTSKGGKITTKPPAKKQSAAAGRSTTASSNPRPPAPPTPGKVTPPPPVPSTLSATTLVSLPAVALGMLPPGIGASEITYFVAYDKLPPGVTLPPGQTLDNLRMLVKTLGMKGPGADKDAPPGPTAQSGTATTLINIPPVAMSFLPAGIGASELTYIIVNDKLPPGVTLPPGQTLENLKNLAKPFGKK